MWDAAQESQKFRWVKRTELHMHIPVGCDRQARIQQDFMVAICLHPVSWKISRRDLASRTFNRHMHARRRLVHRFDFIDHHASLCSVSSTIDISHNCWILPTGKPSASNPPVCWFEWYEARCFLLCLPMVR